MSSSGGESSAGGFDNSVGRGIQTPNRRPRLPANIVNQQDDVEGESGTSPAGIPNVKPRYNPVYQNPQGTAGRVYFTPIHSELTPKSSQNVQQLPRRRNGVTRTEKPSLPAPIRQSQPNPYEQAVPITGTAGRSGNSRRSRDSGKEYSFVHVSRKFSNDG